MASMAFTNASVFFAGFSLGAQHSQLALAFEAESLDATTFGQDTRIKRGGLKVSSLVGSGFWQACSGTVTGAIDQVVFDYHALADVVAVIFPDAITEGATATGSGFMMKADLLKYQTGGKVGSILPFSITAVGRGAGL